MQITRKLPGEALRDGKGNIPFYFGVVQYASERIQWVKSNHPEHKVVFLVGRTFMYWCPNCRTDIWEEEVTRRGRRTCVFCENKVLALSPGDRVRLHYRFDPVKAEWSEWWGQRIVE